MTDLSVMPPGRNVSTLLQALGNGGATGRMRPSAPFPTGFHPLDEALDGGLRAHDLTLVGGAPGVGKTVAMLQWARHMALGGTKVMYVCYEHDETDLLARLLQMELGYVDSTVDVPIDRLRTAAAQAVSGQRSMRDALDDQELVAAAHERVATYAENLWLIRGSGSRTTIGEMRRLVVENGNGHNALFVDYLQKVPADRPLDEDEQVRYVAEALKELALDHDVAVVAAVAADKQGMVAQRLRLHHMRGSSALSYEADVVLVLNDKLDIVSKAHVAYDSRLATTFREQVVMTIEKNRRGQAHLDLEFHKDFAHLRFDPDGRFVAERLVDERVREA